MDLKPGYKQTEVGIIPEDWELRGLLSTVRIGNGQIDPRNEPFRSMILVAPDHVESGTGALLEQKTAEEQRAISGKYVFTDGDIVYSKIRPYLRKAILADFNGLCSADMYPLKPASDVIAGFMLPVILGHRFTKYAESVSVRSGMPKINRAEMADFVVALPPLPEQSVIATVLSDVDKLLGGLNRLIAKKRNLRHAAMQQLLTGKTRLPGFCGEWAVKRIADIASPSSEKNVSGEKFPVLTCSKHLGFVDSLGFFKNQVFSKDLSTYKVIRRDEIGYPANHVEEGSIGLQNLYDLALVSPIYVVFRVDETTNSMFLHRLLKLDSYRQRFKTATTSSVDRRGSLRWPAFSEITVGLPPTKDEQTAIATVLSDMDAELAILEAQCDKTRALKQAMMQELLTGRTRLPASSSNVVAVDFAANSKSAPARQPASKSHNWQINEAVVVAVLVKQFSSEQYPLGRKRCTKLAYLMHRHVEYEAQGYLKKAAGPYNPAVKYKGPENIAQKNGYIRPHANGKFSGFIIADKIAQAEGYFNQWYGRDVLAWLEQFRRHSNDELELLATVDMAVEDLKRVGLQAGVESVKSVISTHPEWEAKLEREIFSDTNIARAIRRVSELFPIEDAL